MTAARTFAFATLAATTLATAAQACPDLTISAEVIQGNGVWIINANVVNIGASPYDSSPGLQRLVSSVAGQPINITAFAPSIRPQHGIRLFVEFPASDNVRHIDIEILYDPAVRSDGLVSNDDCDMTNNRLRVRLPG